MGRGSTPGHKTRSPVGRRAVCTERHQRGGAVGSVAFGVPGPGRQLNECCQSTAAATEANPGGFWGPFGCSQRLKNKPAQKKYFFVKKMDIWHIRAPDGPKSGPFFFLAAPKFYPRQKDPKRVLKAGAWGFVPKSAVWGPPNPEIRNLRPPKFGKKNFFRTCNIFFPKVHPKRSLTHPHRPPSDQNCPKARGGNFFPYVDLPCDI